ncbi:hypothetical protein GCK72_006806 [Caenorhabditis remanei]|uniref:DUF38 domain-containing protein n=1 Tax=Caenorhabditis remanei TaxID=31234 RepID=A0A6A5HG82_CAERE|nr:hypothetical protein GCK72_006806 [Caenorhabditis remanei]KAF1766848.1 hypothetical protein GCK72_006806 [Caenorhabditis remanei]
MVYDVESLHSDELFRHPVIDGVRFFTICCLDCSVSECIKVGQKWMDNDVEIGSRIETINDQYQQIDDYIEAVKAQGWKIVNIAGKTLQIETKNRKKHLLLRVLQDTEIRIQYKEGTIIFIVVPADIQQNDYEKYVGS